MFRALLTTMAAGVLTFAPVSFADSASTTDTIPMKARFDFDINELHDCYNDGEIMFFRNGRMTYAGDDFILREPKQWLVGGEVNPGDKIGFELSEVRIEHEEMSLTLFDLNGKRELRNQDNMPEAGDQWEITISDGVVAFGIGFEHKTAMLALSFDLFDLNNPENRTRLDYSLSCNQEPIPEQNRQKG
ncbi:hypothetical protein [Endozoicomonas lisbonensis]|uniref:Uncharacterized protein n=1 Tax=Endozoicomonas lisbonensis TaxID=3120522 RepID=A0ABV2SB57_9GAMM